MQRFNIRATNLEKFRRYIEEVSEYETEESLIETLSGSFTGNEYTRIGTAFHKIVECGMPDDNEFKLLGIYTPRTDGYDVRFNEAQVNIALAYKNEIRGCFHEIRAEKAYNINGIEVIVSGGADVVLGNIIRDIKTKYSYMKSISDYTDSVQWKLYCDIFELPEFYFDVFEFKGYDKEKNGYDVSGLQLTRHDPIHCIEYSGMQNDIKVLLTEFIDFIRFRKIEHLFVEPLKINTK